MSPPILEIRNLSSEIARQGTPLLQSISISLHEKERLVLTGPSGVGKSLLLRMIVFIDPIKSGEIYFHEKKISQTDIPFFRSQVIYLGQKPSLIEGTVEDNLKGAFKLKIHSEKKYNRERVLTCLKTFDLSEGFLNQQAKLLSGGEAQIMAIIRALILDPKVLLLDEPTASLDSRRSKNFEDCIIDWVNNSQERAFIWITHQREQENRLGTRILNLG